MRPATRWGCRSISYSALGEACVYNVLLRAWDKTVVGEGSVHGAGQLELFPIKIINGPEPL